MNVLVTGATGFIGRHLIDRLTKVELVQARFQYYPSSYHTFNGFMAAAGPSIRADGDLAEVSPLDFTPTFLFLMGEAVPRRMTGRVMNQMIRYQSLGTNPKTIAN